MLTPVSANSVSSNSSVTVVTKDSCLSLLTGLKTQASFRPHKNVVFSFPCRSLRFCQRTSSFLLLTVDVPELVAHQRDLRTTCCVRPHKTNGLGDVVLLLSGLDTILHLVLGVVVSIFLMVAGKSFLPTETL